MFLKPGLKRKAAFVTILIIVFLFMFDVWHTFCRPFAITKDEFYIVKKGATIRTVAEDLQKIGYIRNSSYFVYYALLKGIAGQLKAGEYRISPRMNAHYLLQEMIAGNVVLHSMIVIEGWTFKQAIEAIKNNEYLLKELDYSDIEQIPQQLGFTAQHMEGRIYPDTYSFIRGTTDTEFLQRAWNNMEKKLKQEWENRTTDILLTTPYEALILASIIEKETGVDSERNVISAVFNNRLKKGMRLQSDPTVIYGLGEHFDGDIKYRDLRKDTPYNTYTRNGLPPTPIALPGLASIRAALHPADADVLYFVARGDGSHQFSRTLEEHNHAVRQYQKRKRALKRNPVGDGR